MKLTAKLLIFLIATVFVAVGVEAMVSIRQDIQTFESDMRRDTSQMGRTLRDLVEVVRQIGGQQRAFEVIQDANREESQVSVRWVQLDAPPGDFRRSLADGRLLDEVRSGRQTTFLQRDASGRGNLYTYVPLDVETGQPAALEIVKALDGLDRFRYRTTLRACMVAGIILIASTVLVAVLGITVVGRPLERLIEKTRRVAAGDLSAPLRVSQHDELGELALAFNRMCEHLAEARQNLLAETEARIAAVEQLRHADRLTTVGRLAAGVAHELGTPMNVATIHADMIAEDNPSTETAKSAGVIKSQVQKMVDIIGQLLDFARQKPPRKTLTDLSNLAASTVELLATLARKQHIELRLSSNGRPLTVNADRGQLQQVLTNLLINAFHAMPQGGTVRVDLYHQVAQRPTATDTDPRDWVRIDVRDEGVGITSGELEQIFDPFFTTKEIGEGTGLGLSITHGIVHEHGGWIEVESQPDEGTRFSVYLPSSEPSGTEAA
jgi:two-component system, NtrC family, sensor kinase